MTEVAVSKRGTITPPREIRKSLGLDASAHPMMLAELREGGVFLQPAEAMAVRDIPLATMKAWIDEDECDARRFWEKATK